MQIKNSKKVLLYSGGLDSWLIDKLWNPDVRLYVDINGAYSKIERKRLPKDVVIIDFPLLGTFELENKFVPLRNLYFLMLGSNYGNEVCLGATAGDWGNMDKTPKFLNMAEDMLLYLWSDKKANRNISICKNYVRVPKSELLRTYLSNGGNINEVKKDTFSCYTPINEKECFNCYPCFRKFALLYSNGASYTEEEEYKMWTYIKKNIIPTKEQGGYQGTYYTDRGEESKDLIKCVESLRKKYDNIN